MNKHYNKRWIEQLEHIQMKRQPREKKEGCGSEAEHRNCRVLPDHA